MRYFFGFSVGLAVLAFAACGGDGGECAEPAADTTGEWQMTATPIEDTCGGSLTPYTFPVAIMQDGNALTGQTPEGAMTGTICGNQIRMSGSWTEGSVAQTVNLELTISADGNSVEGSDSWTWTDGVESCSGSESLSGRLQTRGAGELCDATADCESGLECLPLGQFNDGSCTEVATICTHLCTVDADCADLGTDYLCFLMCDGRQSCGRTG